MDPNFDPYGWDNVERFPEVFIHLEDMSGLGGQWLNPEQHISQYRAVKRNDLKPRVALFAPRKPWILEPRGEYNLARSPYKLLQNGKVSSENFYLAQDMKTVVEITSPSLGKWKINGYGILYDPTGSPVKIESLLGKDKLYVYIEYRHVNGQTQAYPADPAATDRQRWFDEQPDRREQAKKRHERNDKLESERQASDLYLANRMRDQQQALAQAEKRLPKIDAGSGPMTLCWTDFVRAVIIKEIGGKNALKGHELIKSNDLLSAATTDLTHWQVFLNPANELILMCLPHTGCGKFAPLYLHRHLYKNVTKERHWDEVGKFKLDPSSNILLHMDGAPVRWKGNEGALYYVVSPVAHQIELANWKGKAQKHAPELVHSVLQAERDRNDRALTLGRKVIKVNVGWGQADQPSERDWRDGRDGRDGRDDAIRKVGWGQADQPPERDWRDGRDGRDDAIREVPEIAGVSQHLAAAAASAIRKGLEGREVPEIAGVSQHLAAAAARAMSRGQDPVEAVRVADDEYNRRHAVKQAGQQISRPTDAERHRKAEAELGANGAYDRYYSAMYGNYEAGYDGRPLPSPQIPRHWQEYFNWDYNGREHAGEPYTENDLYRNYLAGLSGLEGPAQQVPVYVQLRYDAKQGGQRGGRSSTFAWVPALVLAAVTVASAVSGK